MTLDEVLSQKHAVWHLRNDARELLAVIGPCTYSDAVDTCVKIYPKGRAARMKPLPIFHVGVFSKVRHRNDGRIPTATHTVLGLLGRRVAYWRHYPRGWSVTYLGPEWW